jgi:hypothetical protein
MTKDTLKWTLEVVEDPESGELLLQFPEEFLDMQGWKEGDTLVWSDNNDGSWSISKSDKNEIPT